MAYICIIINTNDSISDLNSKVLNHPNGNPREGAVDVRNYLERCIGQIVDSSIQVTSRDTDPSVTTSGTGSTQRTYNLK